MPFRGRRNPIEIKKLNLSDLKKKIMDLVARRDHSILELRKKLKSRAEAHDLDIALDWAQNQSWFVSPDDLSKKVSAQLGRKGQGVRRVNQKLKSLGLAPVDKDENEELEKARHFFKSKWSNTLLKKDYKNLDYDEQKKFKAKIIRSLISRGFENHIISEVLKTDLKMGNWEHEEY